ncbi:hypothetical protein CEXT_171921 [Caerostris extrusa]|uniref:Uncharacterized protein n=1 Tax=Caerostris extrusa TaxID=172846 RepID=A0AAV4V442_CAEEX|nr:hypothetical protein CEXT_171921 [Caerostris extrusa]
MLYAGFKCQKTGHSRYKEHRNPSTISFSRSLSLMAETIASTVSDTTAASLSPPASHSKRKEVAWWWWVQHLKLIRFPCEEPSHHTQENVPLHPPLPSELLLFSHMSKQDVRNGSFDQNGLTSAM